MLVEDDGLLRILPLPPEALIVLALQLVIDNDTLPVIVEST